MNLRELSKDWLECSDAYRPSAFWFWNDGMDSERMRQVVVEMARVGIREFLIHPVHGMEIEYLSPAFFDKYRYALELALEHGLKVWVYDEYGWPSGNAGGVLLREHPEHVGWYLAFERGESGKVTAQPRQSDRILDNTMGAPWTRSERGYVDTLSEDAMGCFIQMTHERIASECGTPFRDAVVGFFTDEPVAMMDEWNGRAGGWTAVGMPWTPSLPERFVERFGYDIESRYAELANEGPNPVKRDYWSLVKEMHSHAYHAQMAEWCHGHGLKYTGHLGEDNPLQQVRFAGSSYQCLQYMDEPGIDFLGCGPEPEHRFVDHVLVPSIARHAGKARVFCEAYGVSPLDIRLGDMLKCAQMFGIYGIDDIALMGFQQSLHGIRKHTYWPPLFMEAPWWGFYPEYRDACARSIALTSLGYRRAKYAILYPQNELEQVDLFSTDLWSGTDAGSRMIRQLGLAIYDSGETFEFVFPEMLGTAQVIDGKVTFPNAEYGVLVAPSDVTFFDESIVELERLAGEGARVMAGPLGCTESDIRTEVPSWRDRADIDHDGSPGDVRVYRFEYSDGELLALRNTTDGVRHVEVSSRLALTHWEPIKGEIRAVATGSAWRMEPHGTLYLTMTEDAWGHEVASVAESTAPLQALWRVSAERPNMARLSNVRFLHAEQGWLGATDPSIMHDTAGRSPIGLPTEFRGKAAVTFCGHFGCASVPDSLGVLFEQEHLRSLYVNGEGVDLSGATPLPVWDASCRYVDISQLAREGPNELRGELAYEEFETSMAGHAFLSERLMPTCDVFLAGSFRSLDGEVCGAAKGPVSLPADFAQEGWAEYDGTITIQASVELAADMAESIVGISVEPASDDCIEVSVDGEVVGRGITAPYTFDMPDRLSPGMHTVQVGVTGTSANLLGNPSPWGIVSAKWIVSVHGVGDYPHPASGAKGWGAWRRTSGWRS